MTLSKPVKIILIIAAGAALVALIVMGNIMRSNSPVKGIQVTIDYPGEDTLMMAEEVEELIRLKMPWVEEQCVKEVERDEIADTVLTSPYLERCEVSVSMGNNIIVKAVQRRPIVRVFRGNEEYYLDVHGKKIPLSEVGSCDVIVANGMLKKGSAIEQVWKMACYLDSHPKYGCIFDQIYINEEGDMLLVPKISNHYVEMGDIENLDSKFEHLVRFYRKAMPKVGWQAYSKVSLKYRGQVICTKRQ